MTDEEEPPQPPPTPPPPRTGLFLGIGLVLGRILDWLLIPNEVRR